MISYNSEIKKLRIRLGLTQRQAADKMNVTERTFCNWENRKPVLDKYDFMRIQDTLTGRGTQ